MRVDSRSAAEDLGLIGLRDLAAAAAGTDYRVVGGHMVQFLQLVYPTATVARATADVDAALDREVEAAGRDLHEGLMRIGYTAVKGNRYERTQGRLGVVVIDLLVNTMGTQLDACRDLHARAVDLDRRRVRGLPRGANPARTAALIRAHVRNPG